MKARLSAIDLSAGTIFAEPADGAGRNPCVSLKTLLCACKRSGLKKIVLSTSLAGDELLSMISTDPHGVPIDAIPPNDMKNLPRDRVIRIASSDKEDSGTVFSFSTSSLDHLLDDVTVLTVFACTIRNLNKASKSNLRFAIYELAVNTIEHGNFHGRRPRIHIELSFSKGRIEAKYMDNATPFDTTQRMDIDIGGLIQRRSKRGYGLYILQRLTEDLRYERNNHWNVTTFDLSVSKRKPLQKQEVQDG